MPIIVEKTTGGYAYGSPILGRIDHTAQIAVPLGDLTTDEIDSKGYLKPGIPLTKAGALVGASPQFVYGVTIEPIKVFEGERPVVTQTTIDALGTITVGVMTAGQVVQDAAEDILGRAYTANEIAGFDRAGSKIVLQ